MPCPKCNGTNIILGGKYKIKRSNILRQRLKCKDCKTTFIVRTKSYRKKISSKIREKITKLYKTKKMYKNVFDSLHKNTYSTREIAKMLNVSKTFVHEIIKRRND